MPIENTATPITVTTFASLKLNPLILNAVQEAGYTIPSHSGLGYSGGDGRS